MAGAKIEVSRTFPKLDELVLTTAAEMREIGLLARERIVARTLAGIDADQNAFEPYSPGYAAQKRQALGTDNVNLQVSGNMLNHLQIVDVDDESVTLGWDQ